MPDRAAADWAATLGVLCLGPFLVYGFRFVNNAVARRLGKDESRTGPR